MGSSFMKDKIISLDEWLSTPAGTLLRAWEQERYDELVADVFGYHALQLGLPGLQTLRANRIGQRWLALDGQQWPNAPQAAAGAPHFWAQAHALPLDQACLDLVTLPHTLELSADPHAALREVQRVLRPQGRVVLSGFNPWSLWGGHQRRWHVYQRLGAGGQSFLPLAGQLLTLGRLRDWLQLLDLELESISFGCYRPALQSPLGLQRCAWMDALGARWWPMLGAAYVLVAVKRVPGMRLLEPAWRKQPQTAGVRVASRSIEISREISRGVKSVE